MADYTVIRRMIDDSNPADYDFDDNELAVYSGMFNGDWNAVAAFCWSVKAAAVQLTAIDTQADNASYSLSQVYDHAINQARYYSSRRTPTTSRWLKDPAETEFTYVAIDDTGSI